MPYFTENIQFPTQNLENEITDPSKKTSFDLNEQSTFKNKGNIKAQESQSQLNNLMTLKTEANYSRKLVQKQSEKFIEVCDKPAKLQNMRRNKKKASGQLFFGMQWRNQNRNIIPNVMNQLLTFVQKNKKSGYLIGKLFNRYPHQQEWTIHRYYCYMRKMKSRMGNYIKQNQLGTFTKIQQPQCTMFGMEQQYFYLKLCRIAIVMFFRQYSALISLTSKRMSHQKRKAHLIAGRALLQRFNDIIDHASQ